MLRVGYFFYTLFVMLLAVHSFAATVQLSPVVVRGMRMARDAQLTVQPVTLLSQELLRRSAGQDLGRLLEGRPGAQILVKGNGFAYGKSGISLRSFGMGSEIVVALDGRKLSNDTDGEGFDLSLIDPVALSQVEVLRGSLSSIYGNGAHAGVVHLSTRLDGEENSGITLWGGNNGYNRQSFYSFQHDKKWAMALAGSNEAMADVRTSDHGVFKNSGHHRGSIYAQLRRKIGQGQWLKFLTLFGRGFRNGLPGDLIVHALEDRDEADDRGYGRIEFGGGEEWRYSVLADWTYKGRRNIRLGPLGSSATSSSKQLSRAYGSQATLKGHWGGHQWLVGVEGRRENHDGSGLMSPVVGPSFQSPKLPPSRVDNLGSFFQDEWQLADGSWIFSTGGRLDWQGRELFDSDTVIFDAAKHTDRSATGHLGLLKTLGSGGIRTGIGTSYVAPNIIQLYTFNARTGFALLGNPSLAPERGYTADAGVFWKRGANRLELTAFTSDIWNRLETGLLLRDGATGGSSFKDLDGAFSRPDLLADSRLVNAPTDKWFYHRNLGQVRVQGLEFGSNFEFEKLQGFWIGASVTAMTYLREKQTGEWLLELPPVAGRLEMGMARSRGVLSVAARGSSAYDSISRTRGGRPRVRVPGYILFSADMRLRLGENLTVLLSGDNLFDRAWQSTLDVPGQGVTGRLGMELKI